MNIPTVYFELIEQLKALNLETIEEVEQFFEKLIKSPLHHMYKTSVYIYWKLGDEIKLKMRAVVNAIRSRSKERAHSYTMLLGQVVMEYSGPGGDQRWMKHFWN